MSDVDLGHDHSLRYFAWSPDRDLNPQYDGIPDDPKVRWQVYAVCGACLDREKEEAR